MISSIQRRLALSITAVLVFSLLVGATLTYFYFLQKVRTEVQAALRVAASGALNTLKTEDAPSDPGPKLVAMVRDFDGDRHVRATFYSPEGRIIMQSRPLAPETPAPAWFYHLVAQRFPPTVLTLPNAFAKAGSLVLSAEPHNEVAEAWSDAELTLVIIAVFFAAVLVLVFVTIRTTLRPLREVCDALALVGRGDLSVRIESGQIAELVPLRDGFNAMAGRLADADRQNRALNEQILTLQEEERAELARDLHDEVAPFVFAIGADAALIRQTLARGQMNEIGQANVTDQAHEIALMAGSIADAVRHMQKHLKGVLRRLAPGALLELGLEGAIGNLSEFWMSRRPTTEISVSVSGDPLDAPLDTIAFRVVQESLSNAMRHGDPSNVAITVDVGENLATVTVCDDGAGLNLNDPRFGFGLTGMQDRVKSVGGTLFVRNRQDGMTGVRVEAMMPIGAKDSGLGERGGRQMELSS